MRDEINDLARSSENECMIINIDHSSNDGTHWTCLFIQNNVSFYFDAFGLAPPEEVVRYCIAQSCDGETLPLRLFNTFPIQKPDEVICGHYSIYVLYRMSNCGVGFSKVQDELYNYSQS
jgi:hypothetical protein